MGPEKVEREERGRAGERSEPEMEPVKVPSHHRKSRASRKGENPQEAVKPLLGLEDERAGRRPSKGKRGGHREAIPRSAATGPRATKRSRKTTLVGTREPQGPSISE